MKLKNAAGSRHGRKNKEGGRNSYKNRNLLRRGGREAGRVRNWETHEIKGKKKQVTKAKN